MLRARKSQKYRDTTGIDPETFKRVLIWCDRNTLMGKRDYALLRLLWGNALRRNEVSQLNIGDFDPNAKTLKILGKGKGTQIETIDLGEGTVEAIALWLEASRGTRPPMAHCSLPSTSITVGIGSRVTDSEKLLSDCVKRLALRR
jgi:integrase/recombinase XerC